MEVNDTWYVFRRWQPLILKTLIQRGVLTVIFFFLLSALLKSLSNQVTIMRTVYLLIRRRTGMLVIP